MMINAQSKRVIPFRLHDAKWVNGFGGLTIGDRSMFGPHSMIHTTNHETYPNKPLQEQSHIKEPVTIGEEVWIAMGVIIPPGITIGDGVIFGAGSVVTKDLPLWTLAVDNPCKAIKQRK